MCGIDFVSDLVWIQLQNYMLRQVALLGTDLMVEGNGAQLNCSSGEYGSGCIGRMGLLANAFTRKASVIVKMDPLTEELERGPDGLCVRVLPFSMMLIQAGDGETGELLFSVDPDGKKDAFRAFQGYYKNTSATNKKKAYDVLTKGDTFFRTGDVIKTQYDGLRRYTLFEDRIGDTFRWKGENVSTMVNPFLHELIGRK
jgi:hypothetical protein